MYFRSAQFNSRSSQFYSRSSNTRLFSLQILYIVQGKFFMALGNPWLPRTDLLAHLNTALQALTTYSSAAVLPVQFIYRYSVLSNRPFGTARLARTFAMAMLLPLLHGLACFYTFQPANPAYDQLIVVSHTSTKGLCFEIDLTLVKLI